MHIKNNKALVDYGSVFSFDVINKIISGLCTIFVIRMLNTDAYAHYTLFNSIASMISSMIGSGITTGFLRMSVKKRSSGNGADGSYYTICIILVFIFSLFLFLLRSLLEKIYSTNTLIITFSIAEAAILSICQLNVYIFQAREKYVTAGKIYNLRNLALFIFLIAIYYLGVHKKADIVILGTICAGAIAILFSFVFLRQVDEFHFPSFSISRKEINNLFYEIRWLILYFAILAMINAMDVIILNRYTGSYYVANYGVAYKYYILLLSLLPSITAILRVKSSAKEYEESAIKRQFFIKTWLKNTGAISLVAIITIPLVSFFIWDVLNGADYKLAYYCFVIFTFGASFSYMFSPMINFMLSAKLHRNLCFLAFCALVFNIIGNYILVNRFAAIGVSITTVLSQVIINLGGTIILMRNDKRLKKYE